MPCEIPAVAVFVTDPLGNDVELTNQRDSLYRITKREYHKNQTLIAGYSYGYDGMGNKEYQEDLRVAADSELYDYDDLDRLTEWERGELNAEKDDIVTTEADQTWNLDPVGNWDETAFDGVTETRDHNYVNELTHRENGLTADLRYDDNGNLIEDDEYEYAYDAFNRLVEVTDKSNDKVIAEYTYDTQNRRTKKKTGSAGDSVGGSASVAYAYDGWQMVEEHEVRGGGGGNGQGKGKGEGQSGPGGGSGGETVRTYTYGSYIDEPITMTTSGAGRSGTFYYHTNNLYNVRALTDERGRVVERYKYSAYGEPKILDPDGTERGKSVVGNPYMFQGRRLDAETGLYYYRNRYYSAALGRFVTRDPMGYEDAYNLYLFVGNVPTTVTDPKGLKIDKIESCNKVWKNRLKRAAKTAEVAMNKMDSFFALPTLEAMETLGECWNAESDPCGKYQNFMNKMGGTWGRTGANLLLAGR
ncbi:MAG: RHS repeat-associated core domain-containing protein [Candidatus Brocadiia bacterium]